MRPGTVVRRQATAAVLTSWAVAGGGRVLDVGGYDGAVTARLVDLGCPVVVLDVDRGGLVQAAAKGMSTILGSATAIPVVSASVDLVLCCDVLPCLPAAAAPGVYPEIRRVMAPGGRLVVTEVDDRFTLPFVKNEDSFAGWNARTGGLSTERLLAMLGHAGMAVVEHHRFYGLPTRMVYTLFFIWGWPRRGARVKHRLWSYVAALDSRWCPRPRAHLVVATPRPVDRRVL